MRKLFSRQLVEARHEMLSIYEAVDLALHDAVKAYVTDDRKLAVTGHLRLPPASDDHLRRL